MSANKRALALQTSVTLVTLLVDKEMNSGKSENVTDVHIFVPLSSGLCMCAAGDRH